MSHEKDPYGLWAWYRDRIVYNAQGRARPFTWRQLFALLTSVQQEFNRNLGPKKCTGLSFMKLDPRPSSRCRNPLCPSCWHVRNSELIAHLQTLKPGPTYYIRSTFEVIWNGQVHPRLVKRFKGAGTRYKLEGYTLNVRAPYRRTTADHLTTDPFFGEPSKQIIGVFRADSPVRDRQAVRVLDDTGQPTNQTQIHVYDGDQVVGCIDQLSFTDPSELIQGWMELLSHPLELYFHDRFWEYVDHLGDPENRPTGKTWCWVNHGKTPTSEEKQRMKQERETRRACRTMGSL